MQRWIKQLEDESCSASVEDGTESTSSQQSTSSRSTPNPLSGGMYIPTLIWMTHLLLHFLKLPKLIEEKTTV